MHQCLTDRISVDVETDLSLAGDRDCPEGQRRIVVCVQASRYELRRLGSRYEAYVIRSSVRGSGCSLGLSGDTEGTLVPRYLALKTLCETYSRLQGYIDRERALSIIFLD